MKNLIDIRERINNAALAFNMGAKEARKLGLDKDMKFWTPLQLHLYYVGISTGAIWGLIAGSIIGILITWLVIVTH